MQKKFSAVFLFTAVLISVRLSNYTSGGNGLFTGMAVPSPVFLDNAGAMEDMFNISPQKTSQPPQDQDTEDNGEFREEHPEITSDDEETLIEE